jgi:hypothetical protein
MNARICSHRAFDRSVPFALSIPVRQVRGWYSGVELKMSRRQGGPSRTVAEEGVDLNRYLTNPAAAGQPPGLARPVSVWIRAFPVPVCPASCSTVCGPLLRKSNCPLATH